MRSKPEAVEPIQYIIGSDLVGTVVEIYASTGSEDQTEGKGPYIDFSYHLEHDDAVVGASGLGYSGPDGDVEKRLALKLKDGRYILLPDTAVVIAANPEAEQKLYDSAMSKLTPAEMKVLERRAKFSAEVCGNE